MLRTDLAQARKFTYRAASCERLDLGDLTADVEEHNREFYLMAQALPALSPGPDLVQQSGVPVEHHQEFHQRERRLGLAVLVARKRIGAAAKDHGRLPLVER